MAVVIVNGTCIAAASSHMHGNVYGMGDDGVSVFHDIRCMVYHSTTYRLIIGDTRGGIRAITLTSPTRGIAQLVHHTICPSPTSLAIGYTISLSSCLYIADNVTNQIMIYHLITGRCAPFIGGNSHDGITMRVCQEARTHMGEYTIGATILTRPYHLTTLPGGLLLILQDNPTESKSASSHSSSSSSLFTSTSVPLIVNVEGYVSRLTAFDLNGSGAIKRLLTTHCDAPYLYALAETTSGSLELHTRKLPEGIPPLTYHCHTAHCTRVPYMQHSLGVFFYSSA